jgi:hypothetical protein
VLDALSWLPRKPEVYDASSLSLRRDAVPVARHLQRANIHGVELHVLLSFVEHHLLRQDRADPHLGVPCALHVQFDDLRRSPVVTAGGDDSCLLQLLHGVGVPHEA